MRRHLVFIDSCAVNRFAALNLDPARALDGSRFSIAYTAGLEAEYGRALAHAHVEPHIKALLKRLLDSGDIHHPPMGKSTDDELVDLTRRHFVVTLDAKPPWDRAARRVGLVTWSSLEADLRAGETLVSVFRSRAPYLDDPSP